MKALPFAFLIGVVGCLPAYSQDSFDFSTSPYDVDAPIFDGHDNFLAGPDFVAVLYGGLTTNSLRLAATEFIHWTPMSPVPLLSGYWAGYFFGGSVFLNITPGSVAWLQVRVWDIRLGQTYEQVAALGLGGYGESTLFQDIGGNPIAPPPSLPGPLYHLQSFSIIPEVPEPSPAVLLLLVALSFLRRGKLYGQR